jgi:LPS-assembly lipoprotein
MIPRRVMITGLFLLPLLAGCGFQPLYAERESGLAVDQALRGMNVAPQTSRTGQLVRNALLEGIPPAESGGGRWRLEMDVREHEYSAVVSNRDDSTQNRLVIDVAYRVADASTGRIVHEGKTFAETTYTRTRLPVANIRARESAREALARVLAMDIRTRLAAWLAARGS